MKSAGRGTWTEEEKLRHSKERSGRHKNTILQYDFDGNFVKEWESIAEASRELKLDYNLLIKCCRMKAKSVGGFQWRYGETVKRVVEQYDLQDNLIKEWDSINLPARHYNIHPSSLNACVNGKSKTAVGFKWKYKTLNGTEKRDSIEPYNKPLTIAPYDNTNKGFKPILQYKLNGDFVREWDSIVEASSHYGKTNGSMISACLTNKHHSAWNYQWRYKTDNYPMKIKPIKTFLQYGLDGKFIREWERLYVIEKEIGVDKEGIYGCIKGTQKTAGGYQWLEMTDTSYPLEIQSLIKPEVAKRKTNHIPVLQYKLNGEFVKEWSSIKDVVGELGIIRTSIVACCEGKLKKVGGFAWRYKQDGEIAQKIQPIQIIKQYDLNWNLINEFDNLRDASKASGCRASSISNCCAGRLSKTGGFFWRIVK